LYIYICVVSLLSGGFGAIIAQCMLTGPAAVPLGKLA